MDKFYIMLTQDARDQGAHTVGVLLYGILEQAKLIYAGNIHYLGKNAGYLDGCLC